MAQVCPMCGSGQVWSRSGYWRSLPRDAADWAAHHPPAGVVTNWTPPSGIAAVAVVAFVVGGGWGIAVGLLAVLALGGWAAWRQQAVKAASTALRAWEAGLLCRGCGGVFPAGLVEAA